MKWVGRCGECQAWGTVVETDRTAARTATVAPSRAATSITDVPATSAPAGATGIGEFDRVLGGGLVPGAVVLIAGEPGIGKSTLALDVAARAARAGRTALYVSGEESAAQVRLRAERTDAIADDLLLAAETDLSTVFGHLEQHRPGLLVVDSVQTLASDSVDGAPGNVAQVREVAASLIQAAKRSNIPTLLIGHVTKDGSVAGPRVLEHLVDVVVQFEGERHSRLRLVRAVKNRYGPVDEVGCFDLSDTGLVGLSDPSGLFLTTRDRQVPGSCVSVTLEGRRPLVVEIQALVGVSSGSHPRRTTSGLDGSRLAMVQAVLERRAGVRTSSFDTYASTVGGVRLREPAMDLAMAMALTSAVTDTPLPAGTLIIGEVGLAGDLRPVSGVGRRLSEGARIGYRRAVVPAGSLAGGEAGGAPEGIKVIEAHTLEQAVEAAFGPRRYSSRDSGRADQRSAPDSRGPGPSDSERGQLISLRSQPPTES